MEKEGLVRSLEILAQKFKIATLVTDRHQQIAKWMKQNAADIDHRYDIWHLAKCRLNFFLFEFYLFVLQLWERR